MLAARMRRLLSALLRRAAMKIEIDAPKQKLALRDGTQGPEDLCGVDRQERPGREERQLLHAARPPHRARQDRRRPAARHGVRAPAADRRGLDARAAREVPGARLDPDAHPVALGLRAGQEPARRRRHHAPLHLHPRLARQRRDGQARLDRLRAHAQRATSSSCSTSCRPTRRSRSASSRSTRACAIVARSGASDHALLADDAGDQLGRRHVEGGIAHRHAFGRPALPR